MQGIVAILQSKQFNLFCKYKSPEKNTKFLLQKA